MKNSKVYSISASQFLVTPSSTGKTGLVLNLETGKSYTRSLKGLQLTTTRRGRKMSVVALTKLNSEKKTASAGMKARIKNMMTKVSIVTPKFDKTLQL